MIISKLQFGSIEKVSHCFCEVTLLAFARKQRGRSNLEIRGCLSVRQAGFVRHCNNGGLAMMPLQRFQLPNLKQIPWIWLVICVLCMGIYNNVYALDLDKLKVSFLQGDYKAAITEGEKAIARRSDASGAGLDELYYLLALSYLKDGNYLRASDIFEIILGEFKESKFKPEAKLGLGDTFFLRGDLNKADDCYRELLKNYPDTKLKAQVYIRLSEVGFKKGDTGQGQEFLDKLKKEFPDNSELKADKELCSLAEFKDGVYYSIQLGSFSKEQNASGLADKLKKSGYDAYIEVIDLGDTKSYRVKVGKLSSRGEASKLENQLSLEGYPTKICP